MRKPPLKSNLLGKRSVIVLILCGLFVLFAGVAIFIGYKQFHSTLENALISDRTVTNMAAMVLQEHENATKGILQSYASRPLFVDSVKLQDVAGVETHMADLKRNNPEMDLTFLTDAKGILWANFPVFPEAIGKDLSSRDWYRGLSSKWQPYISTVYQLIVGDKPLAVAVCVPVFDEKGVVVGILANSHRLSFIGDLFKRIHLDTNLKITVIDQQGHIIFTNNDADPGQINEYPFYRDIEQTVLQKQANLEMQDPQNWYGKRFFAIAPIAGLGWTVIVERSLYDTLYSEYDSLLNTASIATLLFLLIGLFIIYQSSLHRKTISLLKTERQLRQSETRYKHLLENIPDIFHTYSSLHSGIYYSPQVESVLGYTTDYLSNHPTLWHDSIHPDDLPVVNQAIENCTTGQRVEIEYRIRDAHGQEL